MALPFHDWDAAAVRMLRYSGYALVVVAIALGVTWYWALHTTAGARWILARVDAAVGLQVAAVDGDLGGGLELRGLHFANDSIVADLESLELVVDVDLLPPSIEFLRAHASNAVVAVAESESSDDAPIDVAEVLDTLVLPLPVRVSDLRIDGVTLSSQGTSANAERLELTAEWHEDIDVERLQITTAGLDAELTGTLALQDGNALSANIDARLFPALTGIAETLAVTARGSGDPAGLDVDATIGSFATVDGSARWSDELTADAEVLLDGLELAGIADGWPPGFPVSGRVVASLDERRIAVRDSVLEIGGTSARVLIDAEFDRSSDAIDGRLRWERLHWPLPAEKTRVRSDLGDIRVQGADDAWTVNGTIVAGTDDIPDGTFVIDATGTRDGIAGRIVESEVFGGHVAGDAAFARHDARSWSANLELDNVDLGWLLPDWPTVVSGRVASRGTAAPFTLHAELDDINGESRGAPLRADGTVDLAAGDFVATGLQVAHGESLVQLDGRLRSPEGLRFDARVTELHEYADSGEGPLHAQGHMSLTEQDMALHARVESPALSILGTEFVDLQVSLDASDEAQSLRLDGVRLGTDFSVLLSGAFDDWRRPHESRFTGAIDGLKIDLQDEHTLSLSGRSTLLVSKDEAALQEFCIADKTGASLCADAGWKAGGDSFVTAELAAAPAALVEHVAETGLIFDQSVSGRVDWRSDGDAGATGSGELQISPGTITAAEDQALSVATGEGRIDFVIEDGTLLSGGIDLPMPGTGDISGRFAIHEARRIAASGISGSLDANISDITIAALITPLIDSASGQLRAHAELGGTVSSPTLDGELVLEDASFVYGPMGLELTEVNLVGHVDEQFRADLEGTFRAGEGLGEVKSRADYSDADEPGLQFRLRGNGLTLINVPDVFVEADADIGVIVDAEALTFDGELIVPTARVKPTNLSASKVTESDDVVIVAGELPDLPDEPVTANGMRYEGDLNVVLGDDVVVDLDLARATVSGAVAFDWQGDAMPVAVGRYVIGGSIEAFGQVLNISEGSVRFPRVPANKPHIRIVAERDIYGNTQVKRAGVLIDGPIGRPTVEAFTMPLTTEERALTLLVTGSDFDYEQGVGALDFGTYIAPRLFLSYGVGVFEQDNVVSARFDLTKGFGIKASSGSKASGVDLNYRLEN